MDRIRVFPRRTNATPDDECVRIGRPTLFDTDYEQIDISVAFTWDLPLAEQLEKEWQHHGNVTVGGPAVGTVGGEFTPGEYLHDGYVITSRGCPEKCWFCAAWKRDGAVARPLKIHDGWNVLDDNILACPESHIDAVFAMLDRQRHRAEFTGGLHAARITDGVVQKLASLRRRPIIWLAYDEPADWPPFEQATAKLNAAGWTLATRCLRCYVLCGYPGDTMDAAAERCRRALDRGAVPMAMVYRDKKGQKNKEWARWARQWIRPACILSSQPKTL